MTTYRVVVSREDPWWVAVAHGEGLPPHGAATETRTIANLEDKIRDLIVLRTDADLRMPYEQAAQSFDLDWTYSLPPEAAKALAEYQESKRELAEAQDRYAEQAQQAASALTTSVHASVRDAGWLMGISYQRVAQLLAPMRRWNRNRPAPLGVADVSARDETAELMPVFRVAQDYIAGARASEGGAASTARQVGEAMDLGMAEVAAAIKKFGLRPPAATLSGQGTLSPGSHVIVGPNLAAEARVVLGADMITLSDGASVLPLEGIGELSARATRNGITGLSPIQVLTLVLVWLLAVSVPVVQQELPPEAQAIVSNENGMISLALAITLVIVSRKR